MKENTINIFDSYLRNELSESERQQFEGKLETDPEIQAAFEQHKRLVVDIQQIARLETLKMIHGVQEEYLAKKNNSSSKFINLKQLISIAAILIIILGFGFGTYYLLNPDNQKKEIAENQTNFEDESAFGGSQNRNLIINKTIPVLVIDSSTMSISEIKTEIILKIYENKKNDGFYTLTDNILTIFSSQYSSSVSYPIVVRLKNDKSKLYFKFSLAGHWHFCEETNISKKLNTLNDSSLVQKMNLITVK
jgi:hypothetical protein